MKHLIGLITKKVSQWKKASVFDNARFIHKLLFFLFAIPTVLSFNNCSGGFKSAELGPNVNDLLIGTIPLASISSRGSFSCDPSQVALTPALKMTNREYRAALFGLLDDFSGTMGPISADGPLQNLSNNLTSDLISAGRATFKEQPFLLNQLMVTGYFDMAFRAGALLATAPGLSNYPNTNGCLGTATITQSCHQLFVKELSSRAFRTPISTVDANALALKIWDATLSKSDLLQSTFATITQMPEFLYKVYDQGTASPRGARVLNLTAFELATKLSFFLVGKLPDPTLANLAKSGQILDPTILSQQIDRLLLQPGAQDMIKRLFKETYGYDRFGSFSYSPDFLNGLDTTNLPSAMTQELDQYFVDTVLTNKGTFENIMTSQQSNITNSSLAQIYGLGSASGPVTLPADRAGFMSRAAFMSRKPGNYTSPVKRGLAVLESILCEKIGDPPPNAPTSVSEVQLDSQYQSTRQRYEHLTLVPGTSCIYCHSRINSLGFAFEGYDSIGRRRNQESIFTGLTGPAVATVAIDTRTISPDIMATPTAIMDAVDLTRQLSTNDKAMMCFVKQLKSFEARLPSAAADNCQMNSSLSALYGTGSNQGSITEAIKNLILSNDFRTWNY